MFKVLSAVVSSALLFLLMFGLLVVAGLGWYQVRTLESKLRANEYLYENNLRREYYRGLYDGCVAVFLTPSGCLVGIRGAYDHGWYEDASDGFEWPLPDARDTY